MGGNNGELRASPPISRGGVMPHSKVLGLDFTVTEREVIFTDGITYSLREVAAMKGCDPIVTVATHKIKHLFNGRVITAGGR